MFEIIGGALVRELVGIGRQKLTKVFEEEPLGKAWSAACQNIVESYTADAIARGGSDSFQPTALDRRMSDFADSISLPRPEEILQVLLEGWRERRHALPSGEASPFFAGEESEVTPVLTKLANRFFIEVAQIPKYRDPLLVWVALQMSTPSQASSTASMVDEYVRIFADAASRPSRPQPDQARFPLNCASVGASEEFAVEQLLDRVRSLRNVFLMGPAGGGKTEALDRLISALLADRTAKPTVFPVLVDAARVSGFADQFLLFYNGRDETFPSVWDRFLSEALVPIPAKTLDDMGQDAVPFLIIDQLNEVPSYEVAKAILKLAREFVRRRTPRTTYVIVAGRRAPSDLWQDWRVIELTPLAQAVKEEQVDRRYGGGTYQALPPNAKDLLSFPYYLRLALESGSPAKATDADAIVGFLYERLKLDESALNELAEAAFDAYRQDGSTLFSREIFEKILGQAQTDDLVSSAIIEQTGSRRIRFVHQLHHDYLASRHLACTKEWEAAAFDAVSLRANSFDSLRMVVQQIENVSDGDQFLRALYDWNLTAAAVALLESHKLAGTHFNTDVETALLALMAQKAVDPVEDTRNRIKGLAGGLTTALANSLLAAGNESEILDVVKTVAIASSWFIRWRALFTATAPLEEDDVAEIESSDSIIGWTVSNTVRRTGAAASEQQLRQSYRSNLPASGAQMNKGRHVYRTPDEAFHDTVRWRVVHALGTTPSDKNARVLLSALDKDPYHWARYGAARSLVEMAAITADASIRSFILAELQNRAARLVDQKGESRHIVEEIGRAMDHRKAVAGWHTEILPLVEQFCSVKDEEVLAVWKNRRERLLKAAASVPGT